MPNEVSQDTATFSDCFQFILARRIHLDALGRLYPLRGLPFKSVNIITPLSLIIKQIDNMYEIAILKERMKNL